MSPGPRLAMEREPSEIALPLLPEHRILRLHVRNDGDGPVELRRSHLRLLDEAGNDLRAAARPPIVRLEPGASAALDLVYRTRGRPARLVHAGLELRLPGSA